MKKVAIVQSNYIPWKGYFDLIHSVDEFILFDDVQYTKRDWRNRNKIKTPKGTEWMTIPVNVKGKYYQKINETQVSHYQWAEEHWKALLHNYGKAKYFPDLKYDIYQLYEKASQLSLLSEINYLFIDFICQFLGIKKTNV
jgi:WbqC-like protein family